MESTAAGAGRRQQVLTHLSAFAWDSQFTSHFGSEGGWPSSTSTTSPGVLAPARGDLQRHGGAKKAGLVTITADVRQGTRRDAVLFSVGANASHGLRRTNEDKRRAVTVLLTDSEWAVWSNMEIARRCAVGEALVRTLRGEIVTSFKTKLESLPEARTCTTKHGTVATMAVSNIGRAPASGIAAHPSPMMDITTVPVSLSPSLRAIGVRVL
jgi:hypothetical protein